MTALTVQLTAAKGQRGSTQRTMDKSRRMVVDALSFCGLDGNWSLLCRKQVGGKDQYRFRALGMDEEQGGIRLVIKPGDNGSRWEYLLVPPEDADLASVYEKLRKVPGTGKIPRSAASMRPQADGAAASSASAKAPTKRELTAEQKAVNRAAESLGIDSPVHVGLGLYCIAMHVTPEMALEWLTSYHDPAKNRNPSKTTINKYGDDLAHGNWKVTHQGIAFALTETMVRLIDGLNRLHAILEENVAMPLAVFLNVPEDSVLGIDQVRSRKLQEVARMIESDLKTGGSWVRFAIHGYANDKSPLSHHRMLDFVEKHKEAYLWTVEQFDKHGHVPGISIAPVKAAVFRAYYYVDHGRLADFVETLITGRYTGEAEFNAVRLQKQLLNNRGSSSSSVRTRVYGKTTRAIAAYVDGEELAQIRGDIVERYELPDDPQRQLEKKDLMANAQK